MMHTDPPPQLALRQSLFNDYGIKKLASTSFEFSISFKFGLGLRSGFEV